MLSRTYANALAVASEHHRQQKRKGSEIPYLSHLLGVTSLVLENRGNEDEAIAGLLHDAVEDAEDSASLAAIRVLIKAEFGDAVLDIVEACSDSDADEKATERASSAEERMLGWSDRKERYLLHLESAPGPVLLVSASDKVHNARAIVRDLEVVGRDVFSRFNAGEAGTVGYYRRLAEVFAKRKADEPRIAWLADELERLVGEMAAG